MTTTQELSSKEPHSHPLTPKADELISDMLSYELRQMILAPYINHPIPLRMDMEPIIDKICKDYSQEFFNKIYTFIMYRPMIINDYGDTNIEKIKNVAIDLNEIIKSKDIDEWILHNFYDVFSSNITYKDTRDDDIMLYKLEHYKPS